MPANIPTYSETSVIASQALARGSVVSGTIDLRAKFGAWLYARTGRLGATTISNGVLVLIRRQYGLAAAERHPTVPDRQQGGVSGTILNSTVSADSASGQNVLTLAAVTNAAAGDQIVIGPGTAREEWARVSKVSGSTLVLDSNLIYTHTAVQADPVRNKADVFQPIWLEGGAQYNIVFDYGQDTTGDSVQVRATAQTLDSVGY